MKKRINLFLSAAVLITILVSTLAAAVPPSLAQAPEPQAVTVLDMTDVQARQQALSDLEATGISTADIGIQGGSPEYVFLDRFDVAPAGGKVPPGWTQFGSTVGRDNWAEYFSSDGPGSVILGTTAGDYDVLYADVNVPAAKWNASINAEAMVLVKFRVLANTRTQLHFHFQTPEGDARELGHLNTADYAAGTWHTVFLPSVYLESHLARNEGITRIFMVGWGDGAPVYVDQVGVLVIFKTYRWEIDQRILRETDSPAYGQTIGRWWVEDAHGDSTRFWCDTGHCTMLIYAFRSLVGEGRPGSGYRISKFSLPAMPPEENLEVTDYFELPAIRLDEFNEPPELSALKVILEAQLATLAEVQDENSQVYLPLVMTAPPPPPWPKCVGNKCWDNQDQLIADLKKAEKDEWLVANTIQVDLSAAATPPTREQLEAAIAALESGIGAQSNEDLGPIYPLLANDDLYSWPDPSKWVGKIIGPVTFARMLRFREDVNWAGTTIFFWPCVWWLGNLVDLATFLIHGVWYEGYHGILFHVRQNIKQRMWVSEEELVEYYVGLTKQEWEWRSVNVNVDGQEYTGLVAVTEVGLITYLIYVVTPKLAPQTAPLFMLELHGFGGIGIEYTPPIPG